MNYFLFLLFLIITCITGCEDRKNPIDVPFSSKILNLDKHFLEDIKQIDIYSVSEKDEYGFYTSIDELIEREQVLRKLLSKKEINKLFEVLKINTGSVKGCWSLRSNQTLHYIIRRKSTPSVGYFISNSCGAETEYSTIVSYLLPNGGTGIIFSRELFTL